MRLSLAEKAEKDGTGLFLFCFVYALLTVISMFKGGGSIQYR